MHKKEHQVDHLLLLLVFSLCIFSLFAVYSGSGQYAQDQPFYFAIRQFIWYFIGFIIMIVIATFDYELLKKWAFPFYIAGIFALLTVHFFGTIKNGSQRWIHLGIIEIQPSEFMKIFLILYLSYLLSKEGNTKLSFKKSIPITLKVIGFSLIPFLFILVQPDLGSALVIVGVAASLMIVSSISTKMMAIFATGITGLIGFLIYLFQYQHDLFTKILQPHQLSRIYGWLNPSQYSSDYGYQLQQAKMGIGSGQLTGNGLGQGVQVQSGKVPEAHTDFIFAVIGEEFGFIGTSLLIFIYFLLIYRIIQISFQANDLFGVYICIGTVGLIGIQVFQNIGMTIGLTPITGLALPFISYGGSALLTNFIALGLVLSVQLRSKKYIFSENII
ncbi:rod shape-determining protein RodA [Oceanobacillus halophilus]|uniref:Rod shape-determining protein RodA n=1 Tax=Oceanobacillus halophilus TaxID=930130 RepID=A0A494ZS03_9BACI|nr:rod shape-determining protein RodA [Oceanobacillus halophilus]RKQ28549.1 rod shape-determining protein RodA [Oceanobacillus halophilus]